VGLDTVELVLAVEEAFHLEIPNAAAEKMFNHMSHHSGGGKTGGSDWGIEVRK
jgi:hypothetical protein